MVNTPRNQPSLPQILTRTYHRILLSACLLVIVLMVSGFLTIRTYYDRNLELIARSLSYAVEPAIVFGDEQAMRDAIASVAKPHDVRSVELRAPDGRVLVVWDRPRAPLDFADRLPGISIVSQDVRHGQSTIAQLRIAGDTSKVSQYLLSGFVIASGFLAITFFAILFHARRIEDEVISPLADIAQVARDVRGERAFDRRAKPSKIAEIDRFSQDFNSLLAELEGWHATLTEEKDKLAHDASHDPLTGLGNRSLFNSSLQNAVAQGAQAEQTFALLYLDVDNLKRINDEFGHQTGDALLIGVADRLRSSLRAQDHAFRIGGDEFAIVLGAGSDRDTLSAIMARIGLAMAPSLLTPAGGHLTPSLSIGAAIYPENGASEHDLIRTADAEMYRHKLSKRPELMK